MTAAATPSTPGSGTFGPSTHASAACLLAVVLLTLGHLFTPAHWLVWAMGVAALLFFALERRRIPRAIWRVALTLGAITLLLLPVSATPQQSLLRGISIGCLLASLVACVSLLSRAALRSDASRVVALHLLAQNRRRRYVGFSWATQLFGGLIGVTGVSMLMAMASRDEQASPQDRLALFNAITRSFSAAVLWSPMFSNVSILVALYPGLTWFTVVPLSFALGIVVMGIGLLVDRWRPDRATAVAEPDRPAPADPLWPALLPMAAAMGGFLAAVILLSWVAQIAAIGAIVMLAPVGAVVVNALQASGPGRLMQGVADLRDDYLRMPMLAGEVTVFLAAGCGGAVIASAVPVAWTAAIAALVSHSPIVASLALTSTVVGLAFLAVHPVLSVVLVVSCFPPELLGLPPVPHLCSILVGWALASCVSPFAMVSLMASRYSGLPVSEVTVRANRWFALLCLAASAIGLGGYAMVSRGGH
ncbi:MAG: hypothetical protein ABI574_04195 [Burkholderiales bacterium]